MWPGGVTMVAGAAGCRAMAKVRGADPEVDRRGQCGGAPVQDKSPSQEAHDQYAGDSP
jgi:hypothetical protein